MRELTADDMIKVAEVAAADGIPELVFIDDMRSDLSANYGYMARHCYRAAKFNAEMGMPGYCPKNWRGLGCVGFWGDGPEDCVNRFTR